MPALLVPDLSIRMPDAYKSSVRRSRVSGSVQRGDSTFRRGSDTPLLSLGPGSRTLALSSFARSNRSVPPMEKLCIRAFLLPGWAAVV